MNDIVPVVLCGGAGTRLWPLSRRSFPKQFVPLITGMSLLQLTLERVSSISSELICVASEDHRFLVAEALELAVVSGTVILESIPRNTAFAMGLAAMRAQHENASGVLLLFCPADHHIPDTDSFSRTIAQGLAAAESGQVVAFGVDPVFPSPCYGYIQVERPASGGARRVRQFIEKPPVKAAAQLIAQGDSLWNTGIYLARADVLLAMLEHHAPDSYTACREALAAGAVDGPERSGRALFVRTAHEVMSNCMPQSIEDAVMEKCEDLLVVPFEGAWSDVGSWDAVAELAAPGDGHNRGVGQHLALHSYNTYIHAPHRPVAALGVTDLLIIDTPDALLVANRRSADQVNEIVERLDCPQATSHRKVHRPWGWYDCIDRGPRFQVKRLMIKVGAALSLQLHRHRAEHWVVVQGTAEVTRDGETFLLSENQSAYVPLGAKHRLANRGKVPLEIIEVQSGSYLGEDDIERFEDDYGRAAL